MRKLEMKQWVALSALVAVSGCVEDPSMRMGQAAVAPGQTPQQAVVTAENTLTLAVNHDTSVRLSDPNQNFGAANTLDVNRALVQVDAASLASAVGANDYVVSAQLQVTLVPREARRLELQRNAGIHRMTKGWTELGATFQCAIDANTSNRRPDCSGATSWSMIGQAAPFERTPTSIVPIPRSRSGVLSFDVTADVRAFAAGTTNHGWLIKTLIGVGEVAELSSRESAAAPVLVLTVRRCSPQLCDDGSACTDDSCDATAHCVNEAVDDDTLCDDGNACTFDDECSEGACGAGSVAPEGSPCGEAQVCSGASAACVPARVVINEVESSGGVPGDWVELFNAGSSAVDVSGWRFKDGDDSHAFYAIPAGTTIAAGAFLVLEESGFGFGLGGGDTARLYTATSATPVDSYLWTAHAPTTYGRCPDGTGAFATTTVVTKGTPNNCAPIVVPDAGMDGGIDAGTPSQVVINEVESSGGVPGDWAELYNTGSSAADVSGFRFKDNDDSHAFYVIPAGTTIAPGAFLVIEEAGLGFGLGSADTARLYGPSGATPIDSYAWTAHASTTYGRCPDGSGAFATTATPTKGAPNDCGGSPADGGVDAGTGGLTFVAWPGEEVEGGLVAVDTVDNAAAFTGNLSGLTYQPASASAQAVLWAVQNNPSLLFRLEWDGSVFASHVGDGWDTGKTLVYPSGTGVPDSEGVTKAELDSDAIYVATERNNALGSVSRLSILRFDTGAPGSTLTATHEWNLTGDLPAVGANLGLEAITWVPDSYLTAAGFYDESRAQQYLPTNYPDHGTGLFFVGVEASGAIYAYALDHVSGGFQRIATIASGQAGTMGLEFDRDQNALWAYCDDTCGNRATVLAVDDRVGPSLGQFVIRKAFNPPASLPNANNEGIAIAPASECVAGRKNFFWADDGDTAGHSIRRGSIQCMLP